MDIFIYLCLFVADFIGCFIGGMLGWFIANKLGSDKK